MDVHQFQYFEDDRCLGDIYLSMLGPVAFHCFRIDEWIPWHGGWQWVSDKRGIKIEFYPDTRGDGPRANKWTFVYMRIGERISAPRYGIDSYGRNIRMERRCDWIRLHDDSYEIVDHDDIDSIYF